MFYIEICFENNIIYSSLSSPINLTILIYVLNRYLLVSILLCSSDCSETSIYNILFLNTNIKKCNYHIIVRSILEYEAIIYGIQALHVV